MYYQLADYLSPAILGYSKVDDHDGNAAEFSGGPADSKTRIRSKFTSVQLARAVARLRSERKLLNTAEALALSLVNKALAFIENRRTS